MKKTLLTLTSTLLILSSYGMAENSNRNIQDNISNNSQVVPQRGMKLNRANKGRLFDRAIVKIDTTAQQKNQLRTFRQEQQNTMREARQNQIRCNEFTKQGFNKKLFILKAEEKADARIQARATYLEKSYSILSQQQKEALFEEMKKMRQDRRSNRPMRRDMR